LDWVLVRPPRFTGWDAGGNLRVLREGQPGRIDHVVRADLARFLVECATGAEYSCEALAVGS
ncbi:MAG: NAD(P)H-binding protein, partial [Solirubrobacterales bacterium]|nr:NAD(P)H-binding protein [Solirubrobacterales bacterium]